MAEFVFVLTRGPEDPTRVTRCLHLAAVAAEKGHAVRVFLSDDGVYLANVQLAECIKSASCDEATTYLRRLRALHAPIGVCSACAAARGMDEDDLPPAFAMVSAADLIDACAPARVLTF